MSQAQLAADIRAVTAKVDKIGTETQGLKETIARLEEAIANSDGVSQEVKDAMAELQTRAQAVDDAVQDAQPPVDPQEPEVQG